MEIPSTVETRNLSESPFKDAIIQDTAYGPNWKIYSIVEDNETKHYAQFNNFSEVTRVTFDHYTKEFSVKW